MLLLTLGTVLRAGGGLSLNKVVIDAGHGGKDPGCVSGDRKTYEKTLTLDISRKLASLIREQYPGVEVVLTRNSDNYVALDGRAVTANKNDANLFISIHINASPNKSPNGYSIHVLGQSSNKDRDLFAYNMNVCQRENSVVKLEDDYSTKYQGFDPSDPESFIFMTLMQNAYLEQSLLFAQIASDKLAGGPIPTARGIWQDPFYVLWKTSMPAVLVELGFISNLDDLATLRQEENRLELAQRLCDAFGQYKKQYDESVDFSSGQIDDSSVVPPAAADVEAAPVIDKKEPDVLYGVQIFATARNYEQNDPIFLGYSPKVFKTFSFCRYVIGISESLEKTRENFEEIKKKYPEAFLVRFSSESAVPERL